MTSRGRATSSCPPATSARQRGASSSSWGASRRRGRARSRSRCWSRSSSASSTPVTTALETPPARQTRPRRSRAERSREIARLSYAPLSHMRSARQDGGGRRAVAAHRCLHLLRCAASLSSTARRMRSDYQLLTLRMRFAGRCCGRHPPHTLLRVTVRELRPPPPSGDNHTAMTVI